MKYTYIFLIIAVVLMTSCNKSDRLGNLEGIGTYGDLAGGDYSGKLSVFEAKSKGNFGLGTFEGLDGELIVSEGTFYRAGADETVRIANGDQMIAYAVLANFSAEDAVKLNTDGIGRISDIDALNTILQEKISGHNIAVRISGDFGKIVLRAPRKQSEPYPDLETALQEQAVFEKENISGTLIGFLNLGHHGHEHGIHFHFLSSDKSVGGHVLNLEIETVPEIEVLK